MRFLVYLLLLLVIPFVGYAQVKKSPDVITNVNNLLTDTVKALEKGNTPPPQVMTGPGVNDQCGGAVALNNVAPTSTVMTGAPPPTSNGFSTQGVVNDPSQITVGTWFYSNTSSTAWFSYTPTTAGSFSVTLTGIATMKGAEVVIFSGGCPNFTGTNSVTATANQSVIGVGTVATYTTTGPATASATCLLPGVTYYIMVGQCGSGTNYTVSTTFTTTTTGPANNCCSNAVDLTGSTNGATTFTGTTVGATADAPFVGGCNISRNNVWYSFVAQGPNVEVTVAGGATLGPEFQLLSASSGTATDVCAGNSVTSTTCSTSTSGSVTATNVSGTALVTGQTYYVSITSTLTAGGTFSLTVNNPPDNPAGTNCATAALLCTTTPNVYTGGNTNLWGTEELTNATIAGCNTTNGELHSAWYVINVISGGSLTFTISPSTTTDNYDFSLFNNNPATCSLTSPVSCNSSPLTIGSGQTGISPSGNGTTFNSQLTANTGDVFLLMVNSPKPAGTYSVTLGTDGTPPVATYTNCNNFPIILPIELVDFTVVQNENEVDLAWSTASETNNNYFTIERSSNGKDFEELSKVKSLVKNGNSKSTLRYTEVDYSPLAGISYYRLSQTDFNGKTTQFKVVSVINKKDDGAFTIAPNPTDGTLNIAYNCQAATTGTFKLYDSNGVLIMEQNLACESGNNKSQVDLNDKPSGIYFATFTTNSSFYRVKLVRK